MIKSLITSTKKRFDNESKKLIRNSSWIFISNGLGVVLAFLRSILIARGLGAETLGTYAVVIAFVVTIQEILKLNVALGVIKFGAGFLAEDRKDKLVALLKNAVIASLGSAAFSVALIGLVTHFAYPYFFKIPELQQFIYLYAIVNGFAFLDNIGKGVLKIFNKFKLNSIIQMIMDVLEFSVVAYCIFTYPHHLNYFIYTVVSAKFVNTLICNAAVLYEIRGELKGYLHTKRTAIQDQLFEIRHFVLGNSFSNTLKIFMNQGDVLILNWFGTAHMVGVYTVAKKLGYAVLAITDPLSISIYPQLSHLVSKRQFREAKVMIRKITITAAIPISAFMVIAFFIREFVITKVYGNEFAAAADPFFIHLLGAVQSAIFFWAVPLVQSLGLTTMRLKVYSMALGLAAIVSLLLVHVLGATGVAIGLLSANVLISILFTRYCFGHMNRQIQLDHSL